MSSGIDHQKCRICLSNHSEMISYFDPLYSSSKDGASLYSLSELFKRISNIEVQESDCSPEDVCPSCVKTILDFNDLLKTYQESQSYFRRILEYDKKGIGFVNARVNFNDSDDNLSSYEYSDSFCRKDTFSDSKDLANEETNEITSVKYSCEDCGDSFLIKSSFSQHMLHYHKLCIQLNEFDQYTTPIKLKMPKEYSESVLKFVPRTNNVARTGELQCKICKQGFDSQDDLKHHKTIHKVHKCEQCDAVFVKNSYLKDHRLVHSQDKIYSCDVCEKSFKYRNGLSIHKAQHENYRPYVCDVCGNSFNTRSILRKHLKLKHTDEKNFQCGECGLCFKEKSWLDKHFLRKHSGARTKNFVCSMCGVAYLNKYTLTRHLSDKHFGTPKRYYCPVCEKSYTMKCKLNSHIEKKHLEAEQAG